MARSYREEKRAERAARGLAVRTVVERGDPAQVVIECAQKEPADLIVMSSHGRSGFSRWLYGSVAHKVLQHAPCPLLLIRPGEAES